MERLIYKNMFTGIVESLGKITNITLQGNNKTFTIESNFTNELKIDQSIAHDGVCLTIEQIENKYYKVTAIKETLIKTNLNNWQIGQIVNLERCLQLDTRLDGHIMQGHVDSTAICTAYKEQNGSWEYRFKINKEFAPLIIEKGSIALNGTSLTIFDISEDEFSVAIIPYTYNNTSIKNININSIVNIEFDMIGKYLQRNLSLK